MLQGLVDGGKGSKERRRRAHILLLADEDRQGGNPQRVPPTFSEQARQR